MVWERKRNNVKFNQSKSSRFNAASSSGKPTFFNPKQEEVLAAVKTLYVDQLEPFGRILLRRVRERYAATICGSECFSADDAPLVDPKCLHRVCKACKLLHVTPVDGNEISVLLVDRPPAFVDVNSPVDHYPPELWAAASAYFGALRGEDVLLPGGRYACAQTLASRNLPFLAGRSLGEVCHIVQLAVSKKKILGYIDGNMVPYSHSEESVKEKCAACQQPFVSPTKQQELNSWPVASWEETRACLSAILRSASSPGPEPGVITVSNVKRLFRSRFGLDLSETALGYSRLSELLQDPRLRDICTVQIQNAGQFVVHRAAMPMPVRAPGLQPPGGRHRPPPGLQAPGIAAPGLQDPTVVPWNEPRSVRTSGTAGGVWGGASLQNSSVWDAHIPGMPMHVGQGYLNPPPPPALPVIPPPAGGKPPCLGTSPVPAGSLSPPSAVDAFGSLQPPFSLTAEDGEADIAELCPRIATLELTSVEQEPSGDRSTTAGNAPVPCMVPPPGLSLPANSTSIENRENEKGLNNSNGEDQDQESPGAILSAQLQRLFDIDEWENNIDPKEPASEKGTTTTTATTADENNNSMPEQVVADKNSVSGDGVLQLAGITAFQHHIRLV